MRRLSRRFSSEPAPENATPVTLSEAEAFPLLRSGRITGGYRIPWGSNYTFLVWIDAGPGKYLRAIYKPRDGERPLYDFPSGTLYRREYATFLLSRSLGWPDVPLTLVREGPYGIGSMQLYVDSDPEVTYFDLIEDKAEELQQFAVFDMVLNNADRKAGHCLLGTDGRVWSIDHGLSFHPELKLRTVMLEFWGQPVSEPAQVDLQALVVHLNSSNGLVRDLGEMLSETELAALKRRVQLLIDDPVLPVLDPYRNVPRPWV